MTEPATSTETVLLTNPRSGSGDHGSMVRDRAELLGYTIRETEREDHAIDLARDAAREGADEVVAVGGDGTLNEVVRGVMAAGALDARSLALSSRSQAVEMPVGEGYEPEPGEV